MSEYPPGHVTHHDDCGCQSAVLRSEIERLTRERDSAMAKLAAIYEDGEDAHMANLDNLRDMVRALVAMLLECRDERASRHSARHGRPPRGCGARSASRA